MSGRRIAVLAARVGWDVVVGLALAALALLAVLFGGHVTQFVYVDF